MNNVTFEKIVFNDLENNEYFCSLYKKLLSKYALFLVTKHTFSNDSFSEKEINDILIFSDLFSKSTSVKHKELAQSMLVILNCLFPNNDKIRASLESILINSGNYVGIETSKLEYTVEDYLDSFATSYEKTLLEIPGEKQKFFLPQQKIIFNKLSNNAFSLQDQLH